MEEKVLDDLLMFLTPTAEDALKEKALEYVVGLSGTEDGRRSLEPNLSKFAVALANLIDEKSTSFMNDTFKGLINLSSVERVSRDISEHDDIVAKLMKVVCDPDSTHATQASKVLSNVTRDKTSSLHVLNWLEDRENRVIDLSKVVEVLCKHDHNSNCGLHDLASVLANLAQLPEARKFILNKDGCVIQRLLPYTQYSESCVRRRGVVTVLKNCCFETDNHKWLLSDEVDILPHLLLPMAGPEQLDEDDMKGMPEDLQYLDEDKKRETDPAIRKLLIETLMKLCTTKVGRDIVIAKRTYVIMREYDNWEKDEKLKMLAQDLIQILIGDEPEPGMEDLNKVEIPADITARFEKQDLESLQEAAKDVNGEEANS